ncbi:uncharacterized protein VTP21DRAFT_3506 [Calcarisporiella thermophila]|uniref:uncharacterized protein n=1 Tax=Calcarisporiella thermophila TaxID=911321 RepID=UPI003744209B
MTSVRNMAKEEVIEGEIAIQSSDVGDEGTSGSAHDANLSLNKNQSEETIPSESGDVQENESYDAESLEKIPPHLRDRFEKFRKLTARRDASRQANLKDLYAEDQKKKINPRFERRKERKKEEAEKLLAQKEAEEQGEDYQRKQYWNYSIEEVEQWEQRQEEKRKRADFSFTDHNQMAHRKYEKLTSQIKPNLAEYKSHQQQQENEEAATSKPPREAIDRMVVDLNKQLEQREKFSRRRPYNDDDDITYINERNMRFNKKIARFYDRYTKEIRENFERGTAL